MQTQIFRVGITSREQFYLRTNDFRWHCACDTVLWVTVFCYYSIVCQIRIEFYLLTFASIKCQIFSWWVSAVCVRCTRTSDLCTRLNWYLWLRAAVVIVIHPTRMPQRNDVQAIVAHMHIRDSKFNFNLNINCILCLSRTSNACTCINLLANLIYK